MIPLVLKIVIAIWIAIGVFSAVSGIWSQGEMRLKDFPLVVLCLMIGPILLVWFLVSEDGYGDHIIWKKRPRS